MENQKRLIDANAIEAKIEESFRKLIANQNRPDLAAALSYVGDLIIEAPTVDAVEVVHGRWEEFGVADYKCSRCGFRFTSADPISMFQYCRCGAKMDGGNENG